MEEIFSFRFSEITPDSNTVLESQGISANAEIPEKIRVLYDQALAKLENLAEPKAIIKNISTASFTHVFEGEGRNDPAAPLAAIYHRADSLALYALTLGKALATEIDTLFGKNDFASAYMLDSVASVAAEKASTAMEDYLSEELNAAGFDPGRDAVLGYSPGYCGWHISGQKMLFEYLLPERIDITLN